MNTPSKKICRSCENPVKDKDSEFATKSGLRLCSAATTLIEKATYIRGDTLCPWPERYLPKKEVLSKEDQQTPPGQGHKNVEQDQSQQSNSLD